VAIGGGENYLRERFCCRRVLGYSHQFADTKFNARYSLIPIEAKLNTNSLLHLTIVDMPSYTIITWPIDRTTNPSVKLDTHSADL
jgi:hypothetical protein